jgi:hypothetical protein
MTAPTEDDAFWAEQRARAVAERGQNADPSACGACKDRVEHLERVEHDGCAQRAVLLGAPDHPGYELLAGMSAEELTALPPRFHVPVFMDTCTPKAWVCSVCWGEGWTSAWPCAAATEHGNEVFTPEHDAQQHQDRTAAELITLRGRVAELETGVEKVAAFVAQRAEVITAIRNCHPDDSADYNRWQGHAEARRVLAEQLGLPIAWPTEAGDPS